MRDLADLFSKPDDKPVAYRDGKIIYFPEFKQAVETNTSKLKEISRAALQCQDSYNFIVGLFSLLHAGVTIILPANSQSKLTSEYEILVDDKFIQETSANKAALSPLDVNKMSFEFFTSGSTGEPKRITKNIKMLQTEVEILEKLWGKNTATGTVFATVPHQHFYSLIYKILWPFVSYRPFSTVMHGLWEELLPEITADSIIISSPAHLERLGGITTNIKPSRIFCAGAKLPPEAAEQTESILGHLPTEVFGSTETGSIAHRQGQDDWQPMPGVSIRANEDNILEVLSPYIGDEYYTTSDIIEKTNKGFCYLGRADRIVKISGKRVSLPEVEQALSKLSDIQSVAVVWLKDKERLAAAVVLKNTAELEKIGNFRMGRKIREELMANFEPAALPKLWRFVEKLPTHIMGKRRDSDIIALFNNEASESN